MTVPQLADHLVFILRQPHLTLATRPASGWVCLPSKGIRSQSKPCLWSPEPSPSITYPASCGVFYVWSPPIGLETTTRKESFQ
jgi:hypothetical protein